MMYDTCVSLVIRNRFNLPVITKPNSSSDTLPAMYANLTEHCQDAYYGDTTSNFIASSPMICHHDGTGIARGDRQLKLTLRKLCPTHCYAVRFLLTLLFERYVIGETSLTRLIIHVRIFHSFSINFF